MNSNRDLKLIIVDPHEEVCERLSRALDSIPGIRVIKCTTNIVLAAELAHQSEPDVIVADFAWGEAARADGLRWLAQMSPASKLVVYSSYYTEGEREAFRAAGAAKCLLKGLAVRELAAEIERIARPEARVTN